MNSTQNPSVPYRAVGYRRVSMPDQVNGFSLDAQETNITKYIETRNWQLINIYVDAGISAKKGSKRPALEKLLLDAKAGKFDVVVVDKIDRFYRHLGGLLATLDDLNSHGVAFASVQEQLDFTTPWGKLMLTVLGTLAEIYLDNLRQETRKGKLQRARQGLWVGELPFGYCKGFCSRCTNPNGKDYCPEYGKPDKTDGKIIMPHPVESLVVKKVFDWYCQGDTSHRSIADELNRTIITLPDGSTLPAVKEGSLGKQSHVPLHAISFVTWFFGRLMPADWHSLEMMKWVNIEKEKSLWRSYKPSIKPSLMRKHFPVRRRCEFLRAVTASKSMIALCVFIHSLEYCAVVIAAVPCAALQVLEGITKTEISWIISVFAHNQLLLLIR